MALPLPPGLTPSELAFLAENELVTVIPRQRLESLDLLAGPTPPLLPPRTTTLPLWLALLLHRQRRANIVPPSWLTVSALEAIKNTEINSPLEFSPSVPFPNPSASTSKSRSAASSSIISPPFLPHNTANSSSSIALPYYWLEVSTLLLNSSADSFPTSEVHTLHSLIRDLREIRMSKLRRGMVALEGGGVVSLRGVGAMELSAERGFVVGVVGGLRRLGKSREEARRRDGDGDGEDGERGGTGRDWDADDDEDGMEL